MCNIRLLKADEIDVKIKQVTAKGAQALLYKTSRVDMAILDETFGVENWTNEYKDVDGVLYCGIGVRRDVERPFVWKWSNGIESRKDEDGNEVKGEASDALKRAGFLVGIGRELYTAPFIWLSLPTKQRAGGKGYDLEDKFAKFFVRDIEYTADRRIVHLTIVDGKGNVVYTFGNRNIVKQDQKVKERRIQDIADDLGRKLREQEGKDLPWEHGDTTVDETVVDDIWATAQACGFSEDQVLAGIKKYFNKPIPEELTIDEANDLLLRFRSAKQAKEAKDDPLYY